MTLFFWYFKMKIFIFLKLRKKNTCWPKTQTQRSLLSESASKPFFRTTESIVSSSVSGWSVVEENSSPAEIQQSEIGTRERYMGTSVQVTPLCGVYNENPLSYLVSIDGFNFLIDCGWSDHFDPSLLQPLSRYLFHCFCSSLSRILYFLKFIENWKRKIDCGFIRVQQSRICVSYRNNVIES